MRVAEDRKGLLIVGAGPAGLTLAQHLSEAGYKSFSLLEKTRRIGGKSDSMELGDRITELGTCYATPSYRDVLRWMRLQDDGFRTLRSTSVDGRDFRDYITAGPGAPLAVQIAAYLGHRQRLLSALKRRPGDPKLCSEASLPAADWLAAHKLPKIERLMYRAVTSLGYGLLDEVSIYQAMLWTGAGTIKAGATGRLFMPRAGWTRFWERLADDFDIRLSTPIRAIHRGPEGVDITLESGETLRGAAAVCTIPPDAWLGLTTPSANEAGISEAISWKGYATTLLPVRGWFTSEDIRAFSEAFLPGAALGRVVSARYEGYHPPLGGHLYVVGQLPGDYSETELNQLLSEDLVRKGAEPGHPIVTRVWKYFPQYDRQKIADGLLEQMSDIQGQNSTWYSGAAFSHESIANISDFNRQLARRILKQLRS